MSTLNSTPIPLDRLSEVAGIERLWDLGIDPSDFLADMEAAERLATEAEHRFLSDIAAKHRAGQLSQHDLCKVYEGYRAVARAGHSTRWDSVVPFSVVEITHKAFNEPQADGRWRGSWPYPRGTSLPARGQSVVYHLYDDSLDRCYIGSSEDLRARLKNHKKDGKVFGSWMAEPHCDRDAAYEAEETLLQSLSVLPLYNRKFYR